MTEQHLQTSFTGQIIKRKFGKGSKGDRIVNALLTPEGYDIVIRREDGNAFTDPMFDRLQGKTVSITGKIQSSVLIVDECVMVEETTTSAKKEG